MATFTKFIRALACFPIHLYQYLISPWLPPSCRFYPSCSHYALSAINELGLFPGGKMAIMRLLRCHPWGKGGYDPVQTNRENH